MLLSGTCFNTSSTMEEDTGAPLKSLIKSVLTLERPRITYYRQKSLSSN